MKRALAKNRTTLAIDTANAKKWATRKNDGYDRLYGPRRKRRARNWTPLTSIDLLFDPLLSLFGVDNPCNRYAYDPERCNEHDDEIGIVVLSDRSVHDWTMGLSDVLLFSSFVPEGMIPGADKNDYDDADGDSDSNGNLISNTHGRRGSNKLAGERERYFRTVLINGRYTSKEYSKKKEEEARERA